jgi:hypothetical protein
VVAVCAVAVVSGALAGALLLIAAISSPWFVGIAARVRRSVAREASSRPVALDAISELAPEPRQTTRCAVSSDALRELSNQELCHEWRRTFIHLQYASNPDELMRVVSIRQSFLDEIERRRPLALHAWLASGARAAGGPDRFLKDDSGPERPHAD